MSTESETRTTPRGRWYRGLDWSLGLVLLAAALLAPSCWRADRSAERDEPTEIAQQAEIPPATVSEPAPGASAGSGDPDEADDGAQQANAGVHPGLKINVDTGVAAEVVVEADNELIQKQRSDTGHRVQSEDLRQLPTDEAGESIALKAGSIIKERKLHIRGGRGGEVTTYVDGVPGQPDTTAELAFGTKFDSGFAGAVLGESEHAVQIRGKERISISGTSRWNANGTATETQQRSEQAGAQAIEALLASTHDELWVIEKADAQRTSPGNDRPRCGAMLATYGDQRDVPVPLEHTDVETKISAFIATVGVTQTFSNPFDQKIEATYVFPLPHDAAVHEFVMTIGDRRIRGIVREREEAQQIYREAKRRGHVTSLLSQERPNIFKQAVANIEPGKTIDVEIEYFHTLAYVDGWYEYVFPMVVGPRFNPPGFSDGIGAVARQPVPAIAGHGDLGNPGAMASAAPSRAVSARSTDHGVDRHHPGTTSTQPTDVTYLSPDERSGHDIALTIDLDAAVEIEEIESVNHVTHVDRTDTRRASISLAASDRIPNKDFVLRYRVAGDKLKTGILTHRDARGGFFTLMLYPPADLQSVPRQPVEMVFVLDTSGSMNGWPIQKAKVAAERCLRRLRPDDTFQIIRFSQDASQLGPVPIAATPKNIERGVAYLSGLRGGGGTHMLAGIQAALLFPRDPSRLRFVSFMTDGFIGNENQIFAAIHELRGDARVFSFGVGSSTNRFLLDGMARLGRGAVAYVGLDESTMEAVDGFYQRVRYPSLTDVEIDWGTLEVSGVYPRRLPDLFPGRAVVVTGRFAGPVEGAEVVKETPEPIHVHGRVAGRHRSYRLELPDDGSATHAGIASVWARRRIMDLSDEQAAHGDESRAATIRQVALDFGLASSYTSFVAVDSRSQTGTETAATVAVPVPVPAGVKYETTVGR